MSTPWEVVKQVFEQRCSTAGKRECAGAGLDKVRARSEKVTVTPSQGGLRRLTIPTGSNLGRDHALGVLGIRVPLQS